VQTLKFHPSRGTDVIGGFERIATAKKLPSLAAEPAAPSILNNKKVFTVFKAIWSPDPPFLSRILCVLPSVGTNWLTYLYEPPA